MGSSFNGPRQGFSLIEVLITLLIFSTITVGLLVVFDSSSRLARSQTQLAALQQNQRVGQTEIVRYAKMAGLGGLPLSRIQVSDAQLTESARQYKEFGMFPRGYAIEVINSVPSGRKIDSLASTIGGAADVVLTGSDVLIVRGVFTTPIYYMEPPLVISNNVGCNAAAPVAPTALCLAGDRRSLQGVMTIGGKIRVSGKHFQDYPQDIAALSDRLKTAYTSARPEAFILRDTLNPNAYVVAAFDHGSVTDASELDLFKCTNTGLPLNDDANPNCLSFPMKLVRGDATEEKYADVMSGTGLATGSGFTLLAATPGDSPDKDVEIPSRIGSVGLLEEYRFYVSDNPDDDRKMLKRARFLPGTETLIETIVVADNVIDLQLAIGGDSDDFGDDPEYGQITDDGTDLDEVLFNAVADYSGSPENPTIASPPNADIDVWYDPAIEYHFLRINTVVQADARDLRFQAPELTYIEDYIRTDYNSEEQRQFQRRWLQTIVELRNLQ